MQAEKHDLLEARGLDLPNIFTIEVVSKRLRSYCCINDRPDHLALADVMIMLIMRPRVRELFTWVQNAIKSGMLCVPGIKWFNTFLKQYNQTRRFAQNWPRPCCQSTWRQN